LCDLIETNDKCMILFVYYIIRLFRPSLPPRSPTKTTTQLASPKITVRERFFSSQNMAFTNGARNRGCYNCLSNQINARIIISRIRCAPLRMYRDAIRSRINTLSRSHKDCQTHVNLEDTQTSHCH